MAATAAAVAAADAATAEVPCPLTFLHLPNGLSISVCSVHQRNVCRDCGLDMSKDVTKDGYISDDEVEGEGGGLFGRDPVDRKPRNVAFSDLARSKWGTRNFAATPANLITDMYSVESKVTGIFGSPFTQDGVHLWQPGKAQTKTQTRAAGSSRRKANAQAREQGLRPQDIFPPTAAGGGGGGETTLAGFRNRGLPREMLIYTDGACADNGKPNARGGCGFVVNGTVNGRVSFRLEEAGPDGNKRPQTSNRAELRATIAALAFRSWHEHGVDSIVIATDSVYVAEGAVNWARTWRARGWENGKHEPTKNYDLWLHLLMTLTYYHGLGVTVKFWKIPRSWNKEADQAAKDAVDLKPVARYMNIVSIGT